MAIENIEWQTVKLHNARILISEDTLLVQSGWSWENGDTLIIDNIEVTVSLVRRPETGKYPERFGWLLKIVGRNVPQLREKLIFELLTCEKS